MYKNIYNNIIADILISSINSIYLLVIFSYTSVRKKIKLLSKKVLELKFQTLLSSKNSSLLLCTNAGDIMQCM